MSISLITDGMLTYYSSSTGEGIRAPDGTEGHIAPRPAPPCNPVGVETLAVATQLRHTHRDYRALRRQTRRLYKSYGNNARIDLHACDPLR
jgi:hypothetical protein